MKKIAFLLVCSFLVSFFYVIPVDAAQTTYQIMKSGECRLYSSGDNVGLTTYYVSYNTSNFIFCVPVSAIGVDDCFVLTSDKGNRFFATFFWSSYYLAYSSTFWSTNGLKQSTLSSDKCELLTGDLDSDYEKNQILYDQPAVLEVPDRFSSGYICVSGHMENMVACDLTLTVMPLSEARPTPEPTTEPTSEPTPAPTAEPIPAPTPVPTLAPTQTPSISSVSESLGSFGSADGTQTEAYGAFMRFYNKLLGIVTDDSVPDPAPTGYFPDIGAQSLSAYSDLYSVAGYTVDLAEDDTSDTLVKSAVLYKWRVADGVTEVIDESFLLSPYAVEISDSSSPYWDPDAREGTAYALFYRLRLPVRFNYIGNEGDAVSSPCIMVDLEISTSAVDTYGALCQFGHPSLYVDAQSLSYDKYDGMSIGNGFNHALSGVIGITFFDIPISGYYGKYTYDIVLDFPLYISDIDYPLVMMQGSDYEVDVRINAISFTDSYFQNVRTNGTILEEIASEQKHQNEIENERYQQEQETINQATGTASDGLSAVTETLSSWEIFTMPVTVTKDFVTAISSSSSARLTFPSFSLMGQTLWPSYSFDLNTVAEMFPLLCNSLHLISGILVVIWFLRYLWRKWSLITGDDLPDGEVK